MNDINNNINYSKKTILIIVLLIIVGILGIILCCLHIWTTAKNSGIIKTQTVSASLPKGSSIRDILEKYECTNISFAMKSSDNSDEIYYQIYVRFKHNLYENSEPQKNYFESIIKDLSNSLKYSFKLIDDKKDIIIYYDMQTKKYTINDTEDYFKNNAFLEVENRKVIPKFYADRSSSELGRIIESGWKRDNIKWKLEPVNIDSEWLDYEDFKINCTGINMNYVVFFESYKKEITNGIFVGQSFSKVQEALGTPTFKDSNKMIGYKTSDAYMFFYKDKFVAYPCEDYVNLNFEEKVLKYFNKTYEGYRTNFIVEIMDEYVDIKSELIDNGVKLYSYSRGIELYLYDDGTTEIVVYNNYNFSDILLSLAKNGKLKLKLDTDFVFLFEVERNS